MTLRWTPRDGGALLDLSATGPAGAGRHLLVRPHREEGYFRPCAVLFPGEEERELGDGVIGLALAKDTIVKYAIQVLAAHHGVPPDLRVAEDDAPWAERIIAALWELLATPGADPGGPPS